MEEKKQFDIREYMKRWPKFYYFVVFVFSPVYFGGLSSRGFVKKYGIEGGERLNLGSGPRRLGYNFKNVDLFSYEGVDITADIARVPLADSTVSMIVCDNVLEHIEDPVAVVSEMKRLLSVSGVAYISTPFLYPFHSSPSDYQRWTHEGLKQLFVGFDMVEIGVRAGIFSTLTVYLCYLFASIFCFGSHKLYSLLLNISIFIFFPIKYLDIVGNYLPFSQDTASVLYCVVRKR
jgi:SAM-dependent methyltransferase